MAIKNIVIKRSVTRRSDNFDKYAADVKNKKTISIDKEIELAQRIKAGDESAKKELIEANLKFVISVAKQYEATRSVALNLDDLIQEGNLGLIKAAEMFDETRGFKFISYAVWWIRQSILQYVADQGCSVRMPLNMNGLKQRIARINNHFLQEKEREASEEELLNELSEQDSKTLLNMKARGGGFVSDSFSLQDKMGDEDSESFETSVIIGVSEQPECSANAPGHEFMDQVRKAIFSTGIKDKERAWRVIKLSYGLGGTEPMSLDEIAEIEGISRERVRQLCCNIQMRLRALAHSGRISLDDF